MDEERRVAGGGLQAEEASAMARRMVQVYADFATDVAAMPVVVGASPLFCSDCLSRGRRERFLRGGVLHSGSIPMYATEGTLVCVFLCVLRWFDMLKLILLLQYYSWPYICTCDAGSTAKNICKTRSVDDTSDSQAWIWSPRAQVAAGVFCGR